MPAGRPTDYKPEYCSRVDEYLKTTGKEQQTLPKIVSFARFLGVHKDTLYEWKKKHKEFSDSLAKIMAAQEEQLIDDGIYGGKEVNSTIIKLLLENNHGIVGAEKRILEAGEGVDIKLDIRKNDARLYENRELPSK